MSSDSHHHDDEQVAQAFLAAVVAGDTDTLRTIYTPDATIWHNGPGNDGGSTQGVEENLRTLRWLSRTLRGFRYTAVRRDPLPGGYLQRHVLRGTLPDGIEIELAACLIATVTDGRIARIEEYADTRASDPLRAFARAQKTRP